MKPRGIAWDPPRWALGARGALVEYGAVTRFALTLLVSLASAAAAQNGQPPAQYGEGIVAQVEGEVITRYQLEQTCRLAYPGGDYSRKSPLDQLRIQHEQLDALIQERVIKLRAVEEKVTLTPEDQKRVDEDLDSQANQYGGRERLRQALQGEGLTLEFLRERLETNVLTTRLLLKHITRDVYVSPGDVRRYYDQHKDEFQVPALLRIRQIHAPKEPTSFRDQPPPLLDEALKLGPYDARAYIDGLRKRIEGGESFEAVARRGSLGFESSLCKDFSGWTGLGSPQETGWLSSPKLCAEAQSLEVGQLSLVIESETGALHLLLIEENRPAGRRPIGQVQGEIEAALREQNWQRRVRDWIDEAQRRAYVHKNLPPLPPGTPPGQPPRGG